MLGASPSVGSSTSKSGEHKAADKPAADVRMVAPTATLVARTGLHPALTQLFVQAAREVHGESGWFQRKGEFPNARDGERTLAPEAG